MLLGTAVSLAGGYVLLDLGHVTAVKEVAFAKAKELSNGKGIINVGAGPHRTFMSYFIAEQPEVAANIDVVANGMSHFIQLDIEKEGLPFGDKNFGCAFASHILEHLDNWQFALAEMVRVADNVVVVLPDPLYLSGWLSPEHRQHFLADDINGICELYPTVTVYF